jgi:hypothetical protein
MYDSIAGYKLIDHPACSNQSICCMLRGKSLHITTCCVGASFALAVGAVLMLFLALSGKPL